MSNLYILNELYKELKSSGLEYDYLKEIGNNFQSNIRTIFDSQKDGDTISGIISKVFDKTNLVYYFSFHIKKNDDENNKNEG